MKVPRIQQWARLVGLGLACLTALAAAQPAAPRIATSTIWQQVNERCRVLALEPLPPYPWPVAPFYRQHPVRGNFGDPRTVISGDGEGAFSFHNGIDISAWTGNRVYPVVSGVVTKVTSDRVVVQTADNRRFQYIHIAPWVQVGDAVAATTTVLGTIRPRWEHVHLTEIRDGCAVNPLLPGHLTPYRDTTRPRVRAILFEDAAGRQVSPLALGGGVRVLADAFDTPSIPSPFPWGSMPVTPALVTWQVALASGRIVQRGTAGDFRYGEPLRRDFCSVYAPGTEQNFPAVVGSFHWGQPGRYLFDLTANGLDVLRLPAGRYRLTVSATDTAGNTGTRSVTIAVGDRGLTALPATTPDTRCDPAAAAG